MSFLFYQPESFIYHLDEGQTISIPFQVTYPVDCPLTSYEKNCKTAIYMLTPYYQSSAVDTCQNIQSTEAVLFNENKCGIVISSNTWNESKVLSVTGNIDNLINIRDREIYIRLGNNGQRGDSSRAWDNVTIPDIKVGNQNISIKYMLSKKCVCIYIIYILFIVAFFCSFILSICLLKTGLYL